jgi:nitroimidazol reductase NimA-like FMN-containing flavoprotein (pyridoxamine 5'-phosphate oxidase superfamily)
MKETMADSSSRTLHADASQERDAAHARGTQKLNVTVRELSRDECIAILAKHHVGHVGISFHDLLRLKLCNYVYSEGWIYARTEPDEDLVMAQHHPWAAFEVAEVDGILDWRSVEVWGAVEFLSSSMESQEWFEFENAERLFRAVLPEILTADDPMPQRIRLVRIHTDNIMGRESRVGNPRPLPQP